MKSGRVPEHLLGTFVAEYDKHPVVRQHGLFPWELAERARIRFGDEAGLLDAVNQMKARGWIAPLSPAAPERLRSCDRVVLTKLGIARGSERGLLGEMCQPLKELAGLLKKVGEAMKFGI